jgi:hypothetical protein
VVSRTFAYSFEDFRADAKWRVRALNRQLRRSDAVWPGVLILDTPTGLSARAFELGSERERDRLATELLPEEILMQRARRFCWVMPALRDGNDECLLLVFGERGRVEASLASVIRGREMPPRLGRYQDGAFLAGARRVSGRFVEPLAAALEN